tara:strand:+ start:265 stop:651 length:387 start_codon:yes stop_codon:yes gene_type:complete
MGDTSESTLVGIKGYEEFDLKDPNFKRFIKMRMKKFDQTEQEALDAFLKEQKDFKKKKDKKNKVPGGKNGGQVVKMKDGGFPDLTGDGKVTKADILKGRGVFKKGGAVNKKKIIRAAKRGFGAAKRGY